MNKTREFMMDKLEYQWGIDFIAITENFNGQEGGIWLSGENGEEHKDGYRLFDYWNESYTKYTFGIHNKINEWAEENGWYFEWYDGGTLMLWPSWD